MTELAIAVDDNDELWTLDALPTPEAPYVEVESELVEVRSRFPSSYYTLTGETLPPKIRVRRGIAGTTKASHIQGSTLTPNYGLGGGAGGAGVTVDNQSDPPAAVTTLIAPGATIAGDEATLITAQVLSRTVTLTDAQIKVLPTAAVEIVPAPGAGSMIYPIGGILRLNWTADYTNIDALSKLALTQDGGSANNPALLALWDDATVGVTGLLAMGASMFAFTGARMVTGPAGGELIIAAAGYSIFDVEDVGLFLRADNSASGNFTGGDAANTLDVTVLYTVVAL